jgi:hypothetical protein
VPAGSKTVKQRSESVKTPYFISARPDGLGSRIIAALNAIRLATTFDGSPIIFWPDEPGHCSQDSLSAVFSESQIRNWSNQASPVTRLDTWLRKSGVNSLTIVRSNLIDSSTIANHDAWFLANGNDVILIDGETQADATSEMSLRFSHVSLNPSIIDLVASAKQQIAFSPEFLGLHIRRGDMSSHKTGFKRCAPLKCYEAVIERNPKKHFYVSTDSLRLYSYLKNKYGLRLHRMPIESFGRNKEDLSHAMAELLLLSQTSEIFSGTSAFSKAASIIGCTKLTTFVESLEHPE